MHSRSVWWAGVPVVLALLLDVVIVVTPGSWAPELAGGGSLLLVAGAALFAVGWTRHQRREAQAQEHRKQRLTSLASALVRFSSGDLTIQTGGASTDDPHLEACIREFNDITSEPCRRLFYVGSDSLVEGTLAGRTIGERFPKGRLAVLVGSLDGVNFELRRKAALTELREHFPGVQEVAVVESRVDPVWAYDQVRRLLQSEPDLGAIYVTEGGSPAGVAKAVADAGKAGKVLVFGHDVTAATMDAMAKGWIAATIFQDPFAQGYDPAVRLFNLVGAGITPTTNRFVTHIRSVTAENSVQFWDQRLKRSRAGDLSRLVVPVAPTRAKKVRIAVLGLAEDGFWAEVKAGVLAARAALEPWGGHVDWMVPPGDDEPKRIANIGVMVRQVVAAGYDGLALPLHSRAHVAAVNEAVAAGLPVATFNAEPVSFRQTLTTIAAQAEFQLSLSRDLNDLAARGERSAVQIGTSLSSVSQGLGRQKEHVSRTRADLGTLGSTLGTIDSAARSSADAAQRVVQAASESALAVKDSLGAMAALEASSKAIAQSVEELRQETARIAQNVAFIGDIANQTNTLAINASIEAARNGAAGKGFAVIASEIRSLSDQANRAAESITTLLDSVEDKVTLVQSTTQASFQETQRTHSLAARSDAALGVIRQTAEDNEGRMGEILEAVQQVVAFSAQITTVVGNLHRTNEEWDGVVATSLAATDEMTRAVARIAEQAKVLSERSRSQEGMLRQFKRKHD